LGWDELRAQKYSAWEHRLGPVILAQWYLVETRLEWARQYGVKEELAAQLGVVKEEMPRLSAGNVRELWRAALQLPEISVEETAELVVKHLLNRVRVRRSEMKKRGYAPMPP
jgi:hypothetical protein